MKILVILAAVFALNSCNTSIGVYRDTKAAFLWTKGKIQGASDSSSNSGRSNSGGNSNGAPVY